MKFTKCVATEVFCLITQKDLTILTTVEFARKFELHWTTSIGFASQRIGCGKERSWFQIATPALFFGKW
jgi:hypothetical protein